MISKKQCRWSEIVQWTVERDTPAGDHDAIDYVAAHALFYWVGGLFDYKYQRLWGDGCVVVRPDPNDVLIFFRAAI
jgi:hypothetical protein